MLTEQEAWKRIAEAYRAKLVGGRNNVSSDGLCFAAHDLKWTHEIREETQLSMLAKIDRHAPAPSHHDPGWDDDEPLYCWSLCPDGDRQRIEFCEEMARLCREAESI